MKWRVVEEKVFLGISIFSALVVVGILFGIIGVIFLEAIPSLSLEFIITPENKMPGVGGAIGNAIVGTIVISTVATILAIPLGICTAIYLSRYAKDGPVTRGFRFLIEVLSGTPSIVLGIFGLLVLVFYLRQYTGGFSLISGSIALAILIMPVIERAAEDAIRIVDTDLENGSYALGARKWDTIKNITLPYARSGIITGIILAFGRAAEETAVVILTAGYTQFMPEFAVKSHEKLVFGMKIYPIQDLVGTLPYSVYHAFENSHIVSLSDGFAAAFVLIIIILIVNSTAKIILWYSFKTSKKPLPLITTLTRPLFNWGGRFFSRSKYIPAPACAAAELVGIKQESAIRVQAGSPQKARLTPSPISRTSEIDWKETLLAGLQVSNVAGSGSRDLSVPSNDDSIVIPGEGSPLPSNPGGDTLDPDEELRIEEHFDDDALFEDGPVLLHDSAGNDPESTFTPDYHLLEEDPLPPVIESPADEPWRRMLKNRLENTIAGITSESWEGS